jgi:RNA polymerase sigma-70 factor (ECF subfamily)
MEERRLTPEALAELFRDCGDDLLAWFARRTWDRESAVDMTAETFARAVRARGRFRGRSRPEAEGWLFGIARNVLRSYLRRGRVERRALRRLGMEPPAPAPGDLERLERDAGLGALRDALEPHLAALPDDQRRAVHLRVVEELPYHVIAERTGVSPDAVRARVSRGLRALRRAIEHDRIADLV